MINVINSITLNSRLFSTVFTLILLTSNLPIYNCEENMAGGESTTSLFSENSKIFAVKMMKSLMSFKANENVVFSPLSVQICGAMARIGATGETAAQLDKGLGLVSSDKMIMADSFHRILSSYLNSNILKIANKIYVMQGYTVQATFNDLLSKKFYTTADELNFSQNVDAAKTINTWVETNTNNRIRDLVSPNVLNGDTRLVLLNAIHFKGEWEHKFLKSHTQERDFYLNEVDTVKVQMMSQKEFFRYADLPELDATAIELPYKDTDLTMLIILPNSRTGLNKLMEQLHNVPLSEITSKLIKIKVMVKIPKFKAEFEVELNDAFKELGMTRMFSSDAEFDEMLDSPESVKVSKVIHKAFIDVNEEGTEAAAATAAVVRRKRAINIDAPKEFIADHSFLYFINHVESKKKNETHHLAMPLFMGTITTFIDGATNLHDEL